MMNTNPKSLNTSVSAIATGATGNQPASLPTKQSDDIFHLSPLVELHENTISPIHINMPGHFDITTGIPVQHGNDTSLEGDRPGFDRMDEVQSCQVSQFHLVSCKW